ncbi:YidB family protein [Chthonobacter albigriseus]|uniref:YidB family protein n=1 Tax=Chthonobacter albigriseus TaxID=1683161 RepID=UPI0015EF32A2|nr:YidB family protein [Chthonobacter albigriseus]
MARGFPSMTALLGLLAVAGYQNRDKIAEYLGQSRTGSGGANPAGASGGGLGSILGGLTGALGGSQSSPGGVLSGGLGDLVEQFRRNGKGDVADSWVGTGPNRELAPSELEQAIGDDTLADLSEQTGLSRDELLARLSRTLPEAVDRYTPQGRIPREDEFGA